MSSRTTRLIVAALFLLFVGAGIYLWVTSNEEVGNIPVMGPTPEEPIELRNDEVELPDYQRQDSLDSLESWTDR